MNDKESNKAALEYSKENATVGLDYEKVYDAFIAGARWMAEQFKKVEPDGRSGWMTGDKEYVDVLLFYDNALEEPFDVYIRKKDENSTD